MKLWARAKALRFAHDDGGDLLDERLEFVVGCFLHIAIPDLRVAWGRRGQAGRFSQDVDLVGEIFWIGWE